MPDESKERLKVLVVEDSQTLRQLLEVTLTRHLRAEVWVSTNGQEAFEALDAAITPFDLILLDVNMPVMDGFEFLDKRRARPKAATIPTVIMTTEDALEDRDMAFDLGADAFLRKPFQARDITNVVAKLLGPEAISKK